MVIFIWMVICSSQIISFNYSDISSRPQTFKLHFWQAFSRDSKALNIFLFATSVMNLCFHFCSICNVLRFPYFTCLCGHPLLFSVEKSLMMYVYYLVFQAYMLIHMYFYF